MNIYLKMAMSAGVLSLVALNSGYTVLFLAGIGLTIFSGNEYFRERDAGYWTKKHRREGESSFACATRLRGEDYYLTRDERRVARRWRSANSKCYYKGGRCIIWPGDEKYDLYMAGIQEEEGLNLQGWGSIYK